MKDLVGRLPYGINVKVGKYGNPTKIWSIGILELGSYNRAYYNNGLNNDSFSIERIKLYLRPMSSMTEEEFLEYYNIKYSKVTYRNKWKRIDVGKFHNVGIIPIEDYLDWLNSHHFDYRGLIEKGLALEAPKGMYNIKEK